MSKEQHSRDIQSRREELKRTIPQRKLESAVLPYICDHLSPILVASAKKKTLHKIVGPYLS